jgi:hypothetical protein
MEQKFFRYRIGFLQTPPFSGYQLLYVFVTDAHGKPQSESLHSEEVKQQCVKADKADARGAGGDVDASKKGKQTESEAAKERCVYVIGFFALTTS